MAMYSYQRPTRKATSLFIAKLILACLWLSPNLSATWAAVQATFFAAPNGTGEVCSEAAPCSMIGARDKVRTINASMTGDIVVNLRGGTYALDATLVLEPKDSGKDAFKIIYQAYSNEIPIISGGKTVTGWTLDNKAKNIYRTKVDASLQTRQLYVNNRRAVRARTPLNPEGFTRTATGYSTTFTPLQTWANQSDMEVVSLKEWKSFRCGIDTITGNDVKMKSPCWENALVHTHFEIDRISWLENAFELLDEEGEWYFNRTTSYLYYKPKADENMATAQVVVPILEELVAGRGTISAPIRNLTFQGLVFAHATWLRPSTDFGYPDLQATYNQVGINPAMPNVKFVFGENLLFERNLFTRLGGTGLALDSGSHDCTIVGNVFNDISATGVHISNIISAPKDSAVRVQRISVDNNYVTRIGQEYHGAVGIFVGYGIGVSVQHNEICNIPYAGISMGWGWGAPSYHRDGETAYNYIHEIMQVLRDGGGVYTLGPQPGTSIHHNYILNQYNEFGALYPDAGTQFIHWHHNVVSNVIRWLHVQAPSVAHNVFDSNYHDNANFTDLGTDNVLTPNTLVTDGKWPAEAKAIMAGAGLEKVYLDIKEGFKGVPILRQKVSTSPSFPEFAIKARSDGFILEWPLAVRHRVEIYDQRGALLEKRASEGPLQYYFYLRPGLYLVRLTIATGSVGKQAIVLR